MFKDMVTAYQNGAEPILFLGIITHAALKELCGKSTLKIMGK